MTKLFDGRLLLALFAGLLCASLYWFGWARPLDRIIYDVFNEAAPLPVADDIVLIVIDDPSLEELGRWPWPREHHVTLLRRLQQASAAAIAIDILFTEPYRESPQVDVLLGETIAELGNVILPVFVGRDAGVGGLAEIPPVPSIAQAAAAIGHVHIEIDDDGVARRVYLREGLGQPRWRHFAVELAALLQQAPEPLPGDLDQAVLDAPNPRAIIRSHSNLVPFMGPAGSVPRVSYVDVMQGRVPPDALRDKLPQLELD